MNYAVVLFFDEAPCGYAVTESADGVRFRPAPHPFGAETRNTPEITARPAADGWLIDGTDDPSVRTQVSRLLGRPKLPVPQRENREQPCLS